MKLVNKIKEYRIANKYTQQQVADFLGIAQSQYNKHENGKSIINAKQIIDLCKLFKCSPNDLLGFDGVHSIITGKLEGDIDE